MAGYLAALASAKPAPGGGSGAAVAAAVGAALGEMVCNVTLARASAPHRTELAALNDRITALRARLLALAEEDEQAYGQYRVAIRLPKRSESERHERHAAIQAASLAAAKVPLALADTCRELIEVLIETATFGSRSVVSDAQSGAYLAAAAVRSAALNLYANTDVLDDRAAASDLVERFEAIAAAIPSLVAATDTAAAAK